MYNHVCTSYLFFSGIIESLVPLALLLSFVIVTLYSSFTCKVTLRVGEMEKWRERERERERERGYVGGWGGGNTPVSG